MRWKIATLIGLLGTAAFAVVSVDLWRENRRLRHEHPAAVAGQTVDDSREDGSVSVKNRRAADPLALVGVIGKVMGSAVHDPDPAPSNKEKKADVDVDAKRERQQRMIRELLGRHPGESDADYKARVQPVIATALAAPRDRIAEKRRQFEEAAGVTAEQRAQMDAAFQSSEGELLKLADASVAAGDLTPYERNTHGMLNFVGSTVGTVDALDAQLGKILTPDQRGLMGEAGFDWLEYVALTTPWENVNPPPPPPGKPGL
jgi:hypothetical protein